MAYNDAASHRSNELKSCSSTRAGRFAVQESGGEGDVAVFAVEVFGEIEQQGADAGEGFVTVGGKGDGFISRKCPFSPWLKRRATPLSPSSAINTTVSRKNLN
jgi:hypothetical protein